LVAGVILFAAAAAPSGSSEVKIGADKEIVVGFGVNARDTFRLIGESRLTGRGWVKSTGGGDSGLGYTSYRVKPVKGTGPEHGPAGFRHYDTRNLLKDQSLELDVLDGTFSVRGKRERFALVLRVEVVASDDPDCRARARDRHGARGKVSLVEYKDNDERGILNAELDLPCGHHEAWHEIDSNVRIAIVSELEDTPAAVVTLKVNGRSITGKPVINSPAIPIPSGTPLTISCSIPEPLPKGWALEVFHAADPLSPGNGVYYRVTRVTSGTRCPSVTRPGVDANALGGDIVDHVWVNLLRPNKSLHAMADLAFVFKKA
jgi:hypothetical protein